MGAREDILAAARDLTARGLSPFSPADLIREAYRSGSTYPETTLRTFIVGPMCTNSPDNHAVQYHDFVRVDRGAYVLNDEAARPRTPKADRKPQASMPAPTVEKAPISTESEWFWEGNIQAAVVSWLAARGWNIRRVADTAASEHGLDIDAVQDGLRLIVEVKGYPSTTYARGPRQGQAKKHHPATQARAYYSNALLSGLVMRSQHEDARVVLAFPDVGTYRGLAERTVAPLRAAGIEVWLVQEDGAIEAFAVTSVTEGPPSGSESREGSVG